VSTKDGVANTVSNVMKILSAVLELLQSDRLTDRRVAAIRCFFVTFNCGSALKRGCNLLHVANALGIPSLEIIGLHIFTVADVNSS
jgi:hypothetical protein